MMVIVSQVQSDGLKLKKTPFFLLHLLVPLIGILTFFTYQIISQRNANYLVINFCQVLSLIYPIIIAWVTTLVADQEIEASGGFFILNAVSRKQVLFSKHFYLLIFGLLACAFAVLGYHFLNVLLTLNYSLQTTKILQMLIIIFSCSIFQYFLHMMLALYVGGNVSFAVAVVEVLVSALMLTGLGELIWIFFPSAWGVRLISLITTFIRRDVLLNYLQLSQIFLVMGAVTLIMMIILFLSLDKWEGRKNEE